MAVSVLDLLTIGIGPSSARTVTPMRPGGGLRLALRGSGRHFVSLDRVIRTMRDTGRDMQEKYKETSRGGLATHVIHVPVNVTEC